MTWNEYCVHYDESLGEAQCHCELHLEENSNMDIDCAEDCTYYRDNPPPEPDYPPR